jgi:hypothetical protein
MAGPAAGAAPARGTWSSVIRQMMIQNDSTNTGIGNALAAQSFCFSDAMLFISDVI